MNDKPNDYTPETVAKVREAIAARIGLPVAEVFPAPEQSGSASQVGV
jgi:hypothetical protein